MCAMVDAVRKVECDCVVKMWPFAKLLWTLATRTHLQGARVSTSSLSSSADLYVQCALQ